MPRRGVLFYLPVCNWGYVNAYDASKVDNYEARRQLRGFGCQGYVKIYVQKHGRVNL